MSTQLDTQWGARKRAGIKIELLKPRYNGFVPNKLMFNVEDANVQAKTSQATSWALVYKALAGDFCRSSGVGARWRVT